MRDTEARATLKLKSNLLNAVEGRGEAHQTSGSDETVLVGLAQSNTTAEPNYNHLGFRVIPSSRQQAARVGQTELARSQTPPRIGRIVGPQVGVRLQPYSFIDGIRRRRARVDQDTKARQPQTRIRRVTWQQFHNPLDLSPCFTKPVYASSADLASGSHNTPRTHQQRDLAESMIAVCAV
ncbi:unnamed protein product [Protopolystoma xenopodis]|uniref:Uncharacterized protein n=1 Tax=Protopolystoma xenopodis TaxID=117903 RepID=A0A3S4ZJX1_9PLAT|nr:unnamed protein product [Protopolystoma xenopodis]